MFVIYIYIYVWFNFLKTKIISYYADFLIKKNKLINICKTIKPAYAGNTPS